MVKIAPYGAWQSPISAADAAAADGAVGSVRVAGDDVWWTETRPAEGGRHALLRRRGDQTDEVLPAEFNVRNRVHEYGGTAYAVLDDGRVVFTNWADQRLYVSEPGGTPAPISSISFRSDHGVGLAGLITVQFPAASAGASFHAAISSGKLNGMICPTTPSGSLKW